MDEGRPSNGFGHLERDCGLLDSGTHVRPCLLAAIDHRLEMQERRAMRRFY